MPPRRTRASSTSDVSASKKSRTGISVGDPIPSVEILNQDEAPIKFSPDTEGILVLFAYPKANTPGCTNQSKGFGEIYDEFEKLGATVFGLSADTPNAQSKFKEKLGLSFDLLSDREYELIGPLGAKKSPSGVIRSHWVFKNGKLVFYEHGVKPANSPQAALDAAKECVASNEESNEPAEDETRGDEKEEEEDATVTKKSENQPSETKGEDDDSQPKASDDNGEQTEELKPETSAKPSGDTKEPEEEVAKDSKAEDGDAAAPDAATAETSEKKPEGATEPENEAAAPSVEASEQENKPEGEAGPETDDVAPEAPNTDASEQNGTENDHAAPVEESKAGEAAKNDDAEL